MGARLSGDGVDFAVFSAHAERIELCLFSEDGSVETARIDLPERTGDIWHGHVAGLTVGAGRASEFIRISSDLRRVSVLT